MKLSKSHAQTHTHTCFDRAFFLFCHSSLSWIEVLGLKTCFKFSSKMTCDPLKSKEPREKEPEMKGKNKMQRIGGVEGEMERQQRHLRQQTGFSVNPSFCSVWQPDSCCSDSDALHTPLECFDSAVFPLRSFSFVFLKHFASTQQCFEKSSVSTGKSRLCLLCVD